MNLDDLARSTAGLDDETFARRFPDPALVFMSATAPADEPPKVDTPSGGTKLPGKEAFSRTNVLKATDAFPVSEILAGAPDNTPTREVLGHSLVVFLVKSARNPFASMITVGRASNNDHCLPLPTVSKVHAYFAKPPGSAGWRLHDQKATNGTWVDGQRLEPGGSAPLEDGSRIGFGPDARARFFTPAGLHGFLTLYRSGVAV